MKATKLFEIWLFLKLGRGVIRQTGAVIQHKVGLVKNVKQIECHVDHDLVKHEDGRVARERAEQTDRARHD
jgi:hypothetical protein